MTPKKQVSPVIRISQGERDASARATHLEAATRKFLVTTNERKQMSTKTNFKRIALVAVAALGLGVLSAVPSSATISGVTFTVTNGATPLRGTATTLVDADTGTGTGASIGITFLSTNAADTLTVTVYNKNTLSTQSRALLALVDTSTSVNSTVSNSLTGAFDATQKVNTALRPIDSATAGGTTGFRIWGSSSQNATPANRVAGNLGATFALFLDTRAAVPSAGTYTYTVVATAYNFQGAGTTGASAFTVTETSQDVSIVVAPTAAVTAAATTTPSAATSTLTMFATTGGSAETAVNPQLATASASGVAFFRANIKNVSDNDATDTITATVSGPGLLTYTGTSATGKSFSVAQTGAVEWSLRPDGNTGKSTITFSYARTGQTFTRTVDFYAAKASTIAAVVATPVMKVGSNAAALAVTAKDASGNNWTGSLWVYASSAADALVAGSATPQACGTYGAVVEGVTLCAITGTTLGTAKFKVIDASTVALANATSNEVTVTVSPTTAATVKLAFNKATYAPGEKALITVTPVGADGKNLPEVTLGNLLAAGGITSSVQLGAGSDTLTPVSITTSATSSATANTVAGSKTYVVYMPSVGGTVKITATGGTSLPLAGQVEVSATATVTDNAAAALAAVTALATTVASLRTLITTLTNLVLKIQKKVKA
jgi:hypothetical protein